MRLFIYSSKCYLYNLITIISLMLLTLDLGSSESSLAFQLSCYKCQSINYKNVDCEDTFDLRMRKTQVRLCPMDEVCIKIIGTRSSDNMPILIRDCYKLHVLNPSLTTAKIAGSPYMATSIRNSSITYYNSRINGYSYVCSNLLCNVSHQLTLSDHSLLLVAFFISTLYTHLTCRLS